MIIQKVPHYVDSVLTQEVASAALQGGDVVVAWYTNQVNSQSVVHSHPYKNAPDTAEHTHTAQQFVTIAALSHVAALAAVAALCPSVALPDTPVIFSDGATRHIKSRPVRRYGLRAPPALLS